MKAGLVDVGGALVALAAFVGLVVVLGRRRPAGESETTPFRELRALVRSLSPRAVVLGLLVLVGSLAVMGTLAAALDADLRLIRLNEEQSVASYASALVLYAAASIALLMWRDDEGGRGWLMVALALGGFGIDEAAELHERLEVATGLPSFVIVSPLLALGGFGLWRVRHWFRRRRPARVLLAVGIGTWAVSQAIDPFHAGWKSVVEELLEITGSALVLRALHLVARASCGEMPGEDAGTCPGTPQAAGDPRRRENRRAVAGGNQ